MIMVPKNKTISGEIMEIATRVYHIIPCGQCHSISILFNFVISALWHQTL